MRKALGHGEKGFTLIELLVVVAILGIIAVVIVPNVGKFLGMGVVEAANTEAHNVQTAVIAYMAVSSVNSLAPGDGLTVGPADGDNIGPAVAGSDGTTVKSFLINPVGLQATYTMLNDGSIDTATTTGVDDSKWANLSYDSETGWTAD